MPRPFGRCQARGIRSGSQMPPMFESQLDVLLCSEDSLKLKGYMLIVAGNQGPCQGEERC